MTKSDGTEYVLVVVSSDGTETDEFTKKVNSFLKEGWELKGNHRITYRRGCGDVLFSQSMIKQGVDYKT